MVIIHNHLYIQVFKVLLTNEGRVGRVFFVSPTLTDPQILRLFYFFF